MPVLAASRSSKPVYQSRAEPGYVPLKSWAGFAGVLAPSEKRGYTRRPEGLFRVMRKLGMFPREKEKKTYILKPCRRMTYPGQRAQVDVKAVPRCCFKLRLFQYSAIDGFSRPRLFAAYPEQSAYSSADFFKRLVKWYARGGSVWNVSRPAMALSLPAVSLAANRMSPHFLRKPPPSWAAFRQLNF